MRFLSSRALDCDSIPHPRHVSSRDNCLAAPDHFHPAADGGHARLVGGGLSHAQRDLRPPHAVNHEPGRVDVLTQHAARIDLENRTNVQL